ncbi:uncharacterized protein ACHE_20219A [Aspergillus chevalieri]|uniref:Purple acid phosphatase C-terminal domain-containing protein n=1 Tax=Aspergillus chevalieri TaxID=182096 RepID=A0A7R7VHF0_ASPCH|nr:uncharacterized protein ACHE_20219A [Aspergillus chevalieri]BCR84761.1 hypothetical protein ACHE_20219A [Aspergillus chevalieri]
MDIFTEPSSHIHWYERMLPIGNGTIDTASVVNNHTYRTNAGKSTTHIINSMAGNIDSHSEFSSGKGLSNITAVLDKTHYGFNKMTFLYETTLKWDLVRGDD